MSINNNLLMSTDIDYLRKVYPEWFPSPNTIDILAGVIIFSLIFLIPYLYIRFLERRLISLVRDRFIPFIKFRLHLQKLIELINSMLKIQIFKPKEKEQI